MKWSQRNAMRRAKWSICSLVLITALSPIAGAKESAAEGSNELAILYAGYPGGPREKAWLGFLKKSFGKVESIDLRKLDSGAASGFDVVVADWTSRYKDGGYNPDAPKHGCSLREDFTRPIIMIGVVAAELTRSLNLKTDWL